MKILTVSETLAKTGYSSRTTLAAKVEHDDFPKPIQVGANRIGWDESEVDEWLASRPRGFLAPVSDRHDAAA